MEQLEARLHYTVTVSTTGKYIRISGDGANDVIEIYPDLTENGEYDGQMNIYFENGSVNGQTGQYGLDSNVTPALNSKPWIIDLGAGNDTLSIGSFSILFTNTTIKLGVGNDRIVTGGDISYSSLAIDAGPGNDDISLIAGKYHSLSVFGGAGRDKLMITTGHIAGQLQIQDSSGPSNINCSFLSVSKESSIVTGNSIDHLLFDRCSFGRKVLISTQGSDDTIYSVSSRFKAGADVFGVSANDTVIGFSE